MTKLEQIARAICASQTVNNNPEEIRHTLVRGELHDVPQWRFHIKEARAAVEAMAMTGLDEKNSKAAIKEFSKTQPTFKANIAMIYKAVLQAILDEHDEKNEI